LFPVGRTTVLLLALGWGLLDCAAAREMQRNFKQFINYWRRRDITATSMSSATWLE
jgi:myo-inositol catabolism protein IolC